MSNMVKLAAAIVRQSGRDTAKRSAAFDELRKLAEKANAVDACFKVVSDACERLRFKKSDVDACVKAIANSPYSSIGNNALSALANARREEVAAKRRATAEEKAARDALSKSPHVQVASATRVVAPVESE